jgi:4-diphosphocytidyl-2-C-methyl-D-erythritol kinase
MVDDPDRRGASSVIDPTRRLMPVVRLAPAKLNLTLAVGGRRADGYHDLHSVMVPLELSDVLSMAPAPGGGDTLHVEGRDPGPVADNLVLRAIAAAREHVGAGWAGSGAGGGPSGPTAGAAPSLAVRLDKRIPVAAGLGGGSSDAAAALDGAIEAWGAELDDDSRARIAARLGSDVPFFLVGGPAVIEGRGERVRGVPAVTWAAGTAPGVLLVTPAIALSTAAVYAAFDGGVRTTDPGSTRASSVHLATELEAGLTAARLVERAGVLASANDLVGAAASLAPGLVRFRRALARLLHRPIGQSGSGPTVWALYPSLGDAEAARRLVVAAVEDGRLDAPGDAPPTVIATSIAGAGAAHAVASAPDARAAVPATTASDVTAPTTEEPA